MNRVELIAAEVEKAREAARRKADEVGLKLSSEYSVKGLGRSGALLKALLDTDLAAVETVLMTRVDSEDRYPPKGTPQELTVEDERASSDLRSVIETEIAWLETRAREGAQRMGLGGGLANSLSSERDRLLALYERELRIRAGRRQLETESIPYFPDLGIRFHETGRFYVLEAADVAAEEDVQALCELMYQYSDHDVYLFIRQGEAPPDVFAAARESGAIVVTSTEDYFYKHPRFQLDYVRIPPGTARYDWERELEREGREFGRLKLRLSETERVRRAVTEAGRLPDFSPLKRALFALESEEESIQGTSFLLSGVGLVTCHHVLATDTVAIDPETLTRRRVKVLAQHETVDLARVELEGDRNPPSLEASTREVHESDPVFVLGFPSYQLGDKGVVNPGTVSGRRMVNGIPRFLLSAAIIKGMSGGPVLDSRGKVIAVAVTGADRMNQTRETEDQSAIPIDALRHLRILGEGS